jgi:hypothetical protein
MSMQLHEIEKIIAARKMADAVKATSDATAKREARELAVRIKEAFSAAQVSLRKEIDLANQAIQRGGRTEEFRYQPNPQPVAGKLLTANLSLSDGLGMLRDLVLTVDANDGKIVVRGQGITMQQSLTNVLQVSGEDWSTFLTSMYASNMR